MRNPVNISAGLFVSCTAYFYSTQLNSTQLNKRGAKLRNIFQTTYSRRLFFSQGGFFYFKQACHCGLDPQSHQIENLSLTINH